MVVRVHSAAQIDPTGALCGVEASKLLCSRVGSNKRSHPPQAEASWGSEHFMFEEYTTKTNSDSSLESTPRHMTSTGKRPLGSFLLYREFFARSALEVAPDLLGMHLVRRWRGREYAYRITETEAYHGCEDKASHASRGRTKRNAVMFGPAGHLYVYLVYGMYDMLNVVTGSENEPSAVLIRGVEGYDGPGKLTRALHITRTQNALMAIPKNGVWFEDRGDHPSTAYITRTPRIGVAYAGTEWAGKEYRFVLTQ